MTEQYQGRAYNAVQRAFDWMYELDRAAFFRVIQKFGSDKLIDKDTGRMSYTAYIALNPDEIERIYDDAPDPHFPELDHLRITHVTISHLHDELVRPHNIQRVFVDRGEVMSYLDDETKGGVVYTRWDAYVLMPHDGSSHIYLGTAHPRSDGTLRFDWGFYVPDEYLVYPADHKRN